MLLYVDEAVWGSPSLFEELGGVRTFSGRSLRPDDLAGADALIVRSVTRVDASLLAGSRIRFVGTATSGADHIDVRYLASRGIAFADAAGCNSRTVAEYVLAAMLLLARRGGFDWAGKVLGVVGAGRIGSIVADWGESLGMRVLRCDPPLQRAGVGGPYVSANQLAAESDLISLHVPLVREGPDATLDLINDAFLSRIRNGTAIINTSRGEVADEAAMLEAVTNGRVGAAVMDVWRGEPSINARWARAVSIATPHLAGYSCESRRSAARMIHRRLAEFLGKKIEESRDSEAATPRSIEPARDRDDVARALTECVLTATGIVEADLAFRKWLAGAGSAAEFDALRSAGAKRREFTAYAISRDARRSARMAALLDRWGFAGR